MSIPGPQGEVEDFSTQALDFALGLLSDLAPPGSFDLPRPAASLAALRAPIQPEADLRPKPGRPPLDLALVPNR